MTVTDAQITRTVVTNEIVRTLNQWAHALDTGAFEDFMDCHTEGSQMEVFSKGHPFIEREDYKNFVDMNVNQGQHLHVVTTPHIVLNEAGDAAKVSSYVVRLDPWGEDKEPLTRAFAIYHDDFVASEDGRWRIAYRYIERVAFNLAGVPKGHPVDIHPAAPVGAGS